jgi:hypothetical protein
LRSTSISKHCPFNSISMFHMQFFFKIWYSLVGDLGLCVPILVLDIIKAKVDGLYSSGVILEWHACPSLVWGHWMWINRDTNSVM